MDLREYIQRTRLHKDRTGGDVPFTHLTVEVSVFIFYLFTMDLISENPIVDLGPSTDSQLSRTLSRAPRSPRDAREPTAETRETRVMTRERGSLVVRSYRIEGP